MGDENEVNIIIKAVSNAAGVMKEIAADTRMLVTILSRLEKSLNTVSAAQKQNIAVTTASNKAGIDAAKIAKLSADADLQKAKAAGVAAQAQAKVTTEEERAAAVLLKSQAQINQVNQQAALVAQRRLTEEQRTSKAIADEALNRAAKVGRIMADAAKADAQVAGMQIRNNAMLEKAERDRQRELEKTARALEQKAKAEKKAADAAAAAAKQPTPVEKVQDLIATLGPAIAVVTAFGVAAKKAFDFAEEGANLERLRVTGTALAKGFGVDMVEAVAKIKAASLGTLTAQEAMLATNRALLLGIAADTDKLAVLMEIAAIRGRALGLDTTTSFDRIILGIGRISTRILDDLGIVIDGETAYANYGAAIGKTADDLTEAEKRIALTNAIIEDGNKILEDTGGLANDNAAAFERFTANLTDFKNEMAETFGAGLAPMVDGLNQFFFAFKEASDVAVAHAREVATTSSSYAEYKTELQRVASLLGLVIDNEGQLIKVTQGSAGVRIEVVEANYRLDEANWALIKSTHELSEADKTSGAQAEQLARILAEKEKALQKARDAVEDYITTVNGFSLAQAGQSAIEAAGHFATTEKELQAMQIQFGLLDVEVMKFNAAIKKAAEDGVVSMNEFRDAFFPVAQAQIENLRQELGKGLVDIQDETIKKLNDLRDDYESDLLKDNIDLTRDLEDIELDRARALEDLTSESTEKRADEEKKHKDKLVDIERDYQRDIDKIMRKFEMARLRALIDLDARALFEAEQQRDSDLKDAKDTAKDKREDEEKDYEKRIEDLNDFNKEKREAIEKDYRREREDAQTQYRRQRDDAEAAMADRQRDIEEDAAQRLADLATDFENQKAVIESQLGIIQTNYQEAYNERVEDMLDFFDTNQNILLALKNGTVSLSELRDQFNATGGIPFGGVPFTPDPSETPPPPPTHNCQPGYSWNPVTMRCEQDPQLVPGNNDVVTPASGSVVGTVRLEIVGDGNLARMVRESAANVFAEIIAE